MNAPVTPHPSTSNNPAPQTQNLLRFLTCGSVDDGKSTLIGRLLYECGAVFDDQLDTLDKDSKKFGTQGDNRDFALLVDGLSAEREQGITIDVAYRYFSTPRRKFIVADTPGHEQYTRNMATGASTADLAILLIDARKGVLTQTRRHAFIASLLRVRHIVLAINKMDLVSYDKHVFDTIQSSFRTAARDLGFATITAIPVSARDGDNIVENSTQTPWYKGPSLLSHLETIDLDDERSRTRGFTMPVQWVNRPHLDFRGFAGTIASGEISTGQTVRVLPKGTSSDVKRIVTYDGDKNTASAGEAVTLTLSSEMDISRGDVLVAGETSARHGLEISAHLVWTSELPLRTGARYVIKLASGQANAEITTIHRIVDINTYATQPATEAPLNGVALVTMRLDKALVFDDYIANRTLGGLILIDRFSNETSAIGLVAPDIYMREVEKADALTQFILKHAGATGSRQRQTFLRRLTTDSLTAIIIGMGTGLIIGEILPAIIFGLGDFLLHQTMRALGHRWFQRANGFADGDGI